MEGLTSGETKRKRGRLEERAEVGVQDLLPEEEGHDRPQGQERSERNRHRAGLRTVAREQDDCGKQGLGRYVMVGLMIGMLAALLPAVVLLARHGSKARNMAIPFGPFLAFGAIVAFFFGQELLDAYLSVFF